jgi:hypothetical protein
MIFSFDLIVDFQLPHIKHPSSIVHTAPDATSIAGVMLSRLLMEEESPDIVRSIAISPSP